MKKEIFIPLLIAIIPLLLFIPLSQFVLYILFGCLWIVSCTLLITERKKEKTNEMLPRIILFLVLFNLALSIAFTRVVLTSEDISNLNSKFWKDLGLILTYAIITAVLYFGSIYCNKTKKLCLKTADISPNMSNEEKEFLNRLAGSVIFLFGQSKALYFLCVICIIGNAAFGLIQGNLEVVYLSSIKTMILIVLSIVPNVLMSMTVKQSLKKVSH